MRCALALALAASACPASGAGELAIDAPPRDAPAPCVRRDLDLGRCEHEDGTACTGAPGESRRFAELAEGGAVTVVSGPQGAAMLVFSARTEGIVAGDPLDPLDPDNPLLEVVVARGEAELALYRGKLGFTPDGEGRVVAAGLFVITEGSDLHDVPLTAHGLLVDVDGARRCGEVGFVATR